MKVNIGLVQMSCTESVEDNIQKAVRMTREAAKKGANIVCLQELFSSLYFCDIETQENFKYGEAVPGPTTDIFCALAKELDIVIIASLFEKRAKGLYHNTTAVIDAGGRYLGKYRKMHIPDDPGYYEKYYFTPGDLGYKVWETKYGKLGVLICWDQWYPEAARITALKGAEILFYPTAIGWDIEEKDKTINQEQLNAWKTIQKSHAVANGVYVVAVNRVGTEAGQKFWGTSFVANPHGRVLQEASNDQEEVLIQEIDFNVMEYYRTIWPYLRDRRIDSYSEITKRYIDHEL